MSAAVLRIVSFVALAVAAAVLWVALFRSTGGIVTATPAIPSFSSQSIFAPATPPTSGLAVRGIVRKGACENCVVHVGSGGLVRAGVPAGAGKRTAYALLDIGNHSASGPVLVHDVIGFGRGETPARRVRLLQVLDPSHRVIFELVAGPERLLYLTSPAGGLRATPLVLATGAIVPNDGISGVAVDVALKINRWILVSVNGMRTAAVRGLGGARTGAPRFLAAGVIAYKAPPNAAPITATHAQVSFSTSPAAAGTAGEPAGQASSAAQPAQTPAPSIVSLAPPTVSGRGIVGETLTATSGSWSDPSATYTYAWERCDGNGDCTAIDGADGKTYDLVPADHEAFVRVRVTAHVGDASESKASAVIGPITSAAPTAVARPRISGDAVIGSPLSADAGSWSDPEATFTFDWQRCDQNAVCKTIAGAYDPTYIPSGDDLGSSLRVEVTASNDGGANTAYSVPTNAVVPAAPAIVNGPTLSGDATVGSTLTADPGTWSDPTAAYTYAWLRCHGTANCTPIEGAGDATYVVTSEDVGFRIEVTVTAANAGGSNDATSNLVGPVVPQSPPAVVTLPGLSGDAVVGSTLTADPGTWSDPSASFAYVWLRCDAGGACSTIDAAGGATYTLTADDLGSSIGVEVTATGAGGTGTATSSLLGPVVPQPPPAVVTLPELSGDAVVGSTLTADPGTWSDPSASFTYAWLRCDAGGACSIIDGAGGATYTLTADDLGSSIGVEVTATGAGGTGTATSGLLGPVVFQAPPAVVTLPELSGDADVGSTLTADPGTWNDPAATFTYAWLRCHGDASVSCRAIEGADATTYTLADDDLEFLMRVEVTAANRSGTATAMSAPTGPVEPAGESSPTAASEAP